MKFSKTFFLKLYEYRSLWCIKLAIVKIIKIVKFISFTMGKEPFRVFERNCLHYEGLSIISG